MLLHAPERGDRAPDADEQEPLQASGLDLGEHGEVRGEAGLDASRLENLLDARREDRSGLHPVVGLARDAHDPLHLPAAKHLDRDRGDDPGPLRALHRVALLRVENLPDDAEPRLVVAQVPAPAVHRGLERLHPGHPVPEERARVLDVRDVVRVAQTALRAVLLRGVRAPGLDRARLLPPIRRDRANGNREATPGGATAREAGGRGEGERPGVSAQRRHREARRGARAWTERARPNRTSGRGEEGLIDHSWAATRIIFSVGRCASVGERRFASRMMAGRVS